MADDLAREVVADPRWRWAAGMRVLEPEYGTACRLAWADSTYWHACAEDAAGPCWYRIPLDRMVERVPDLDDPATAGVLVGMLEKERPNVIISRASDGTWFANAGRVVDTSLGRAAARAWLAMGAS